MPNPTRIHFYLGAPTGAGFVSYFKQIINPGLLKRVFLIKGGPGTGKSTLMKECVKQARDGIVELIHCSADPDSLDGAVFHKQKTAILDATPPHELEPAYPGAFERMVNITECWDNKKLYSQKKEIIGCTKKVSDLHKRARSYILAASSLIFDNISYSANCVDEKKLKTYAANLIKREVPAKQVCGKDHARLLSAITPKGVVTYTDTVTTLCNRIFVVQDSLGGASSLLMEELRRLVLACGYEFYTCYCSLSPYDRIEHILIPELSLAFCTENTSFPLGLTPFRNINASRFLDKEKLSQRKQRMSFNKKAAVSMIEQASECLKKALSFHDELEAYYIGATDFNKVNVLKDTVVKEILEK